MSDKRLALNDFFISVQMKALRQAEIACGSREDALDIVQEAMVRLTQRYANKQDDWGKLFQRILQNLIKDWYRRKKVRSVLLWFQQTEQDDCELESLPGVETETQKEPEKAIRLEQINTRVLVALKQLPHRQQQAFLLRAWWEYGTDECSFAMECSAGSVKTHYSRALARLRELLGDIEFG